MRYSQQEYDMVRRQTIQMEEEKRALIRLFLMITSVALAMALVLLGIVYRQYTKVSSEIGSAKGEAHDASTKYQQCAQDLQQKTDQLNQRAAAATAQRERNEALIAKVTGGAASANEVAEFARTVYEMPGHTVEVNRMPKNALFHNYKLRTQDRIEVYTLVPGQVDGKSVIYANLVLTTPLPK